MSDFVNFNKRDVDLPPGCKDLIDVLGFDQPVAESAPTKRPDAIRTTGTVADLDKHCGRILASRGKMAALRASLADGLLCAHVFKMVDRDVQVCLTFPEDEDLATALSAFLERHGLDRLSHSAGDPIPPAYLPSSSVEMIWNISPVPPSQTDLSRLLKDMFQASYGAEDNTQIYFFFFEGPLRIRAA